MEQVPNTYPHLFWAYTVVWTILGAYIASLVVRLNRIERGSQPKSKSSAKE